MTLGCHCSQCRARRGLPAYPPPAPVPEDAPSFAQCVIGYRTWRVRDWVLEPLSMGHPWRPGVNTARCHYTGELLTFGTPPTPLPDAHPAPHPECDCGLYALHKIPEFDDGQVVGAVAAWGRLEVHANGFRAEYAQILALAEARADGPDLDAVRETYGVPVVRFTDLIEEAHKHGEPLPASVIPEWSQSAGYVFGAAIPGGFSSGFFSKLVSMPALSVQFVTTPVTVTVPPEPVFQIPSPGDSIEAIAEQIQSDSRDFSARQDALLRSYARNGPARPKRPPRKLR